MTKSQRLVFHKISDSTYFLSGATINPRTGRYTPVIESTVKRRIVMPSEVKTLTRSASQSD
jgi:hypothetical protein